ncbi:UNVERIFIED_CONTAM: hypothetical protein RMT77_018538 [Armadillidium vulgare]
MLNSVATYTVLYFFFCLCLRRIIKLFQFTNQFQSFLIPRSIFFYRWEFRSTGCDIAYEISRTISEEVEELIPLQRVNSQVFKEEGSLICDEKGLYKIMLKNEYSDKDVDLYYNIDLKKSEGQIDVQLVEVHS